MDQMVLATQQWLNATYGEDPRFERVTENGKTGWETIYGLRRALQIELGIQETSNSFGPTTYSLCPTINQGSQGNLVYIVQGGLWCKGYSPGGFTGYYGNGTYAAVQLLKADMGFPNASGHMNKDVMRGLLDMSAFVLLDGGTEEIRSIQQKLNYNYYDYYKITPCDGLYNREMNKMLIYALQCEEGIVKANATGTWGPTTIEKCPTLMLGDNNDYVKLVRYALVCNGISVDIDSSTYDATLDSMIEDFAFSLKLEKEEGVIDYTIIKSLLSSNGDVDRPARACDTSTRLDNAKIQTLKSNGYEVVGRYLTKVEGGLDKNMTAEEINLILENGLSIFPIFQEYGGGNNAFSRVTGVNNAYSAHAAAEGLGIPFGTTIYFAVDYDPQTTEIYDYIVPYFEGIYEAFEFHCKRTYGIGVYGTRNVCHILKESLGAKINGYFVSDASYGFSGNLGFVMPSEWDFDQFKTDLTIGSGAGAISIDKVALSGRSRGFSYIENHNKDVDMVCETLQKLFWQAMNYTDKGWIEANTLVIRYLREQDPSYVGTLWNITGGEADSGFKEIADEIAQNFTFNDPKTGESYDFYHFIATLSAFTCISEVPGFEEIVNWEVFDPVVNVFAGWGGDLTTFGKDIQDYATDEEHPSNMEDYQEYANRIICTESNTSSFSLADYNADIDAVNVAYLLDNNMNIAEAFYTYFIEYNGEAVKHRTPAFVSRNYNGLEGFNTAIDAFAEGIVEEPYLDPFAYLKSRLTGGVIVRPEYNTAAATAFKGFVASELTKEA